MIIRAAKAGDVEAMSEVFVAFITELCVADHRGDPAIVERWTANKKPESPMRWLEEPDTQVFVAEDGGEVVGIGSFRDSAIQADYVAPKARFIGVSEALLARMERSIRDRGFGEAMPTSIETAHRFYRSAGWSDSGPPQQKFGVASVYPMSKKLA